MRKSPSKKIREIKVEKYPGSNFSLLEIKIDTGKKRKKLFYIEPPDIFQLILLNAERWKEEIINLRATRVIQLERRAIIDFSFIKEYLDKGGIVVQTVKCPECGGPIDIPESGDTVRCTYCGAIIHAQNVFEKIKQILWGQQ